MQQTGQYEAVRLERDARRGWMCGVVVCVGLSFAVGQFGRPVPAAAFVDKKAAGAELFASSGCAHCHGNNGQGTDRAPGLHDLRKKLSEEKIQDQIVHGGQGMPAFGDSLKPDEVEDLVSFLRAKKWITPPQPAPAPAKKDDGAAPSAQ